MHKLEKTYLLKRENIDRISEEIVEICTSLKMRREEIIRIRLFCESALEEWLNAFGKDVIIEIKADKLFLTPYLTFNLAHENTCNPLPPEKEGDYISILKKNLTIVPDYYYKNGKNTLYFKLPKPAINPLVKFLLVIFSALLFGVLGMKLVSPEIITLLQENIVSPVYNKFLDVLRCIASPLIFCSVAWGIYGIGDTSTLSKVGKGLIFRFFRDVFFIAVGCVVFFPIMGCIISGNNTDFTQIFSVLSMFLDMIPVSIVDPFITGNTLQIIVLATGFGIALIYLGKKTRAVANAIEELNLIVNFLMTAISKMVPFFIAFVLVNMIWSGNLSVLVGSWKFIVLLLIGLLIVILLNIGLVSLKFKASPVLLAQKAIPPFLIALVTASSSATFGTLVKSCENDFGVKNSLTSFGVPLGIVMRKVGTIVNNMLIAFYVASMYQVECSLNWIIMAVIVATITTIATPPVPGGCVIAYTMLFTNLGLPEEGLAIALALDMLTDFLTTSVNIFCLPFSLSSVASHYDMLDRNRLKAKKEC